MDIQPLEESTTERVTVLAQSSPRSVIALHVEEAFQDLSERLGVVWEEVAEPSEGAKRAIVIIVASAMGVILRDTAGLSRASSLSESALGHTQSISVSGKNERWLSSLDVSRIAKHLGLESETTKKTYEVFFQARYGGSGVIGCSCVGGRCWCPSDY